MIQHGTVTRFGNRGFGFARLDCDHRLLGNQCPEHGEPVFVQMNGMRFTETNELGTRFHPDQELARKLLPTPLEGDDVRGRLVMTTTRTQRGLVAVRWTFEALWNETERLFQSIVRSA